MQNAAKAKTILFWRCSVSSVSLNKRPQSFMWNTTKKTRTHILYIKMALRLPTSLDVRPSLSPIAITRCGQKNDGDVLMK